MPLLDPAHYWHISRLLSCCSGHEIEAELSREYCCCYVRWPAAGAPRSPHTLHNYYFIKYSKICKCLNQTHVIHNLIYLSWTLQNPPCRQCCSCSWCVGWWLGWPVWPCQWWPGLARQGSKIITTADTLTIRHTTLISTQQYSYWITIKSIDIWYA